MAYNSDADLKHLLKTDANKRATDLLWLKQRLSALETEIRKLRTKLRRLDSRIGELEERIEKLNKEIERVTVEDDKDTVTIASETVGSIAVLASGLISLATWGRETVWVALTGVGAFCTGFYVVRSYLKFKEETSKEDVETYSTELNECYKLKTIVQTTLESKLKDKRDLANRIGAGTHLLQYRSCLDLQRMLGNIEAQEPLASLTWASVRRNLQAYLLIADFNDVIMFVHDQIKQVVYRKLVQYKNCLEKYHKLFADYIEWWSDSRELKMHSLPHHFVAAKLNRRLVNFLRNTKEGGELPFFHRSGYFQRMRCNMLADPVIKGVQPAVICTFCKNSRSVYQPSRLFTNESMCVVCGNQTVGVPQFTKDAFYCHRHSVHIHPTMRKCCLCGGIADRSTVPAKLCSNCSFGNSGNQCCIVDPK